MANLFSHNPGPEALFDLKGSTVGRSTPPEDRKPGTFHGSSHRFMSVTLCFNSISL